MKQSLECPTPELVSGLMLLLVLASTTAGADDAISDLQRCLLQQIDAVPEGTTVEEIKAVCRARLQPQASSKTLDRQPDEASLISRRKRAEQATEDNPFVLTQHKSNYVLPVSYNDSLNTDPYELDDVDYDRIEMKFQFSFKFPVVDDLFDTDADLYFAYTNLSFWQAYNSSDSAPFRETNHEPELFIVRENDWRLLGWTNSLVQLGLSHQSNGKSGELSRSWNRLYAQVVLERDKLFLALKPWYRFQESAEEDDNPGIDDYMGHGELWLGYKQGRNTYSLMVRANPLTGGKGALQLDWSFPMYRRFRGYLQYLNGYGESLIDYDAYTHRLGFGIELTELL